MQSLDHSTSRSEEMQDEEPEYHNDPIDTDAMVNAMSTQWTDAHIDSGVASVAQWHAGIPNLGNTCYLASVVQALSASELLCNELHSDSDAPVSRLRQAMSATITRLRSASFRCVSIQHLFWEFKRKCPEFRLGQQHDAFHALHCLFQCSGMLSVVGENSLLEFVTCRHNHESLNSYYQCPGPLALKVPQNVADLSPEHRYVQLQSLLHSFFSDTQTRRDCHECGRERVQSEAHVRFLVTPPVLCLHITAVEEGNGERLRMPYVLQYEYTLDIKPWCADTSIAGPVLYDLVGIVEHIPDQQQGCIYDMATGHYTARVRMAACRR